MNTKDTNRTAEPVTYLDVALPSSVAPVDVLAALPRQLVQRVQYNLSQPIRLKVVLHDDATPATTDTIRESLEPLELAGAPLRRGFIGTVDPDRSIGTSNDAAQA